MSLRRLRFRRCPWTQLWDARMPQWLETKRGPPPSQEMQIGHFYLTSPSFFFSLNFIYLSKLTLDPYIFHYSSKTPTRLSRTLKSRFTMPPTLNGFETRGLVDACQSDKPVHNSAEHRDFPEPHTEDRCHQVEMSHGDQSPVKRADHHEDGGENVQFLHDHFLHALCLLLTACLTIEKNYLTARKIHAKLKVE